MLCATSLLFHYITVLFIFLSLSIGKLLINTVKVSHSEAVIHIVDNIMMNVLCGKPLDI